MASALKACKHDSSGDESAVVRTLLSMVPPNGGGGYQSRDGFMPDIFIAYFQWS